MTAILNALGVARSTYYRWCTAGITLLTVHEKAIIKLCQSTKYRNGHRKIKALLNQENKINLNRNTIQRIMQKHNLQCRVKPKRKLKRSEEHTSELQSHGHNVCRLLLE